MYPLQRFFSILVLIFLTAGCSMGQENSGTIPVTEYFQKLSQAKDKQLIDVRTPGEYSEGHLANSVNIDYNGANFEAALDKLDKNKPTFIYCLSGGRSGSALQAFARKGFKLVYNMEGGIMQWKARNYPLAGSDPGAQVWKGMTKENFNALVNGPRPVLIDFKAAWCAPCKQLKPILDEIANEKKGKFDVVFIDVDENKSLADMLKISSIPLLVFYEKGKPKHNIEGFADKQTILKAIGY